MQVTAGARLLAARVRQGVNVTALIIVSIVVLGAGLRLWGITYGLPYLYHPDEPLGVQTALNIVKTGDLNPHFYGYGSLFFYLTAVAYVPYFWLGTVLGVFHSLADIPNLYVVALGVGQTLMPSEMMVARLVSAVLGMLCIVAAYDLGSRLRDRRTGRLAAVFVALSPTIVDHSQLVTPNILATLAVLLTLSALIRLTPYSRWPAYTLVGALFGAALASKYNAAMLVTACLAAFVAVRGRQLLRTPGVYVSGGAAVLAFLVLTPYAVLDAPKFLADTQFHLSYYSTANHPGMEGNTLEFYVTYLLRQEGGLAFIGLLATSVYIWQRSRTGLILAAFAVPYVIYISTLRLRNDRTILIALPILLVMAADLIGLTWNLVARRPASRSRLALQTILIGLIVISSSYQTWRSISLNIQRTTPDGREYARQWLVAHLSPQDKIAAESYTPFLDPATHAVTYLNSLRVHAPDWYVEQGYKWLVLSSDSYGRFFVDPEVYPAEVAQYTSLRDRFPEAQVFDQNGITIRILRVTP